MIFPKYHVGDLITVKIPASCDKKKYNFYKGIVDICDQGSCHFYRIKTIYPKRQYGRMMWAEERQIIGVWCKKKNISIRENTYIPYHE